MIHKLLHLMLTRLRDNLADAFRVAPDTMAQHIAPGPVTPPSPPALPYIALSLTTMVVEQWASLTTGLLCTSHDDLLAAYNADVPVLSLPSDVTNTYRSGQVVTTHTITQIRLLEGLPSPAATPCHMQLRWAVAGQFKLAKEQVEGVGVIEQIVSPGQPPAPGVALDVQLGQAPRRR